jgi:hypothetical protein
MDDSSFEQHVSWGKGEANELAFQEAEVLVFEEERETDGVTGSPFSRTGVLPVSDGPALQEAEVLLFEEEEEREADGVASVLQDWASGGDGDEILGERVRQLRMRLERVHKLCTPISTPLRENGQPEQEQHEQEQRLGEIEAGGVTGLNLEKIGVQEEGWGQDVLVGERGGGGHALGGGGGGDLDEVEVGFDVEGSGGGEGAGIDDAVVAEEGGKRALLSLVSGTAGEAVGGVSFYLFHHSLALVANSHTMAPIYFYSLPHRRWRRRVGFWRAR